MNNNPIKKLGLLGGTFNPIHSGHVFMAREAKRALALDDVWFLVSGNPPHKASSASQRDRMRMVELAVEGEFTVSTLELDRPGKSYTVDTLQEILVQMPLTELYFLIGADTVFELKNWKDFEQVFRLTKIVAFGRPGCDATAVETEIAGLTSRYGCRIHLLESMGPGISSTTVRQRTTQQLTLTGYVPDSVNDYIAKHGLYMNEAIHYNEAVQLVKSALPEKRFAHTMGVVEMATMLAAAHGCEVMAARWAALLHDVAKKIPFEESLNMCQERNIEIIEDFYASPKIIHSFLGASIAKMDYLIDDIDILNAIKYHTTGRPGMSKLEMVLYLADYIEPNRNFPELSQLRARAMSSLDDAMVMGLELTMRYIHEEGGHLCGITSQALQYYMNNRKVENI